MKSLFDPTVFEEILGRIDQLDQNAKWSGIAKFP
jgi:hypothetical protein